MGCTEVMEPEEVSFARLVLSFVSKIVLCGRERGAGRAWKSGGMRGGEWTSVAIEGSMGGWGGELHCCFIYTSVFTVSLVS